MKDVKLPNSTKSKGVKKPLIELPLQESAFDTSNWENRNVGAVTFDTGTNKHRVRMVDFMKAEQGEPIGYTLDQIKEVLKKQGFSPEQIQQKLEAANLTKKPSK